MNNNKLPPEFFPLPFHIVESETLLALRAALAAGKEIIHIYENGFTTTFKEDKQPVTQADIASNECILKILQETNYPILSEETKDTSERLDHDRIWIIDPLDGTREFINKNGEFSIMIALVERKQPILGVVYQPTNKLLYVAQKNQGCFQRLNNGWEKLTISNIKKLEEARAILSKSDYPEKDRQFIRNINVKKISQKGSAGLKVGEICSGNAEFYYKTNNKLKEWDTAAAYIMISEAGGKMTDLRGNELIYNQKEVIHQNGILVSNGILHKKLINNLIKYYSEDKG